MYILIKLFTFENKSTIWSIFLDKELPVFLLLVLQLSEENSRKKYWCRCFKRGAGFHGCSRGPFLLVTGGVSVEIRRQDRRHFMISLVLAISLRWHALTIYGEHDSPIGDRHYPKELQSFKIPPKCWSLRLERCRKEHPTTDKKREY